MLIKEVDTTQVLTWKDGRYGSGKPVRVLSHEAYNGNGQNGLHKTENRTRRSFGGHVRIGGFPAVMGKWGESDEKALAAMRDITLEQVIRGEIPDVLKLMILTSARNVHAEKWDDYAARQAMLAEQRKVAVANKARLENEGMLAEQELREAMEALGFTLSDHVRLGSNANYVTLTTSHAEARELARSLRGAR